MQKEMPNSLLSTKNQIFRSRTSLLSNENSKKAQTVMQSAAKREGDFQVIEEEPDHYRYASNVSLPFTIKNPYLKALAEDESDNDELAEARHFAQLNADQSYKSPIGKAMKGEQSILSSVAEINRIKDNVKAKIKTKYAFSKQESVPKQRFD